MGLQVVILQDDLGPYNEGTENVETWLVDDSIDMDEIYREWKQTRNLKPFLGMSTKTQIIQQWSFADYIKNECGAELLPFVEYER